MQTFIQNGDCLTVPAPAGGTRSGELYKVGAIIGVAATTEPAGALVVLKLGGVFKLPKLAAESWAMGDRLYMDVATRLLTNTPLASLVLVGMATEPAPNQAGAGVCRLNGIAAPAEIEAQLEGK
ncbi:DUF2190 family protein [Pseudomonas sp. LJDD11]|uniref:DUF2190 family protein n=1 Tax=Pseudomonas sp. LJDD11 TaxID=2931984 RepID=UPI00211C5007|nr:DUF2190 family protein [Pseudomonas sp. LJDD11]MCQ9423370.1 DUF2190 family protein [Pseudomonas sp. LJDD11]